MGKALKAVGTAIIIVGAIAATGGAALAFGAGAGLLGSASLATSAVLSIGSFSVSAGALLSVGSLVSSIGGSLSQPKVSTAGSALGWVGDPNGPMHFAVGRIAVGGDLRHKKAYGPNDRMFFSAVTVLSDAGPIAGFEGFTANDVPVTFGADGKATSSFYGGKLWRRTQLGHQPEASYLASPSGLEGGATLPNWGPQHKLSGKAATILTMVENSKGSAYKGQQPRPQEIIRGLLVYDWRQDSTYPGGAGSQRLNDPSTWTFSENPALWAAKWKYGLWEGPTGKGAPQVDYQVGGIGVTPGVIDFASLTELANIADTHGWKVAARPSTDDDKAQVLNAFLQAAGAYYIEKSGKMSCLHRAAPRVSVATVTAADTAGPIELDTSSSYVDRKNTGVPTYLSEADGWKMTALGEVSASEWVTQDGGRQRSMPMTYSFVPVAKQAAELMCLGIANTREGISGRIPLKPYMQGIEAGSAFTITEPEFVLNGLKCLALETSYDATTGVHTVTFVSETDGKYAYAYGQSPTPPAPPALEAVDPTFVTPPGAGDWTITPRPPAPGGQLPGFDLGGIVSNDTATSIIVEHGPTDDGPWKQAYEGPPTVTNIPIDGLQPGAFYYIAIQYRRDSNYSDRHVYGPFQAPPLVAGDVIEIGGRPVSELLDQIDETSSRIDEVQEEADAALEAAVTTLNLALGQLDGRVDDIDLDINDPSTGLKVRVGQAEQVSNDAASRVTAVEVEVDGFSSSIATLEQATVDLAAGKADASRVLGLEAVARASALLPSTFVDAAASGYRRLGAGAPGGAGISAVNMNDHPTDGWTYVTTTNTSALFDYVVQNVNNVSWRISARLRGSDAPSAARFVYYSLDKSYNVTSSNFVQVQVPATGTFEYSVTFGPQGDIPLPAVSTSANFLRFGIGFVMAGGGIRMIWLKADDITDVEAVQSSVSTLENTVADLENSKAEASVVTGISAEIQNARNGSANLAAQLTSMRQATTDGLAEKATTTEVSTLRSEVQTARNGSSTLGAQLTTMRQTVSDGLAGKAGASDFNSLKAEVTGARGTASSLSSRLDTVQADVDGKASASRVTSLEAEAEDLRSDLQVTLGVAADAKNRVGEAYFRIIAASGDNPVAFEVRTAAGTGGSAISMFADRIYWGGNTVFDDATDTLQTVVGSRRRVMAFGAPFGSAGNLLEWWGPSNVSLGSMTTANGYNGRMTSAPYVFDNVVSNPLKAKSNRYQGSKTRSGAGSITSDTYTITASGGVAPYSYSWTNISGDTSINMTGGSSSSTAFTTTLALGQSKGATFACIVQDANGDVVTIIVKTSFTEVS